MTEAFIMGHFSTDLNLHGADPRSAVKVSVTLAVEGIDPAARAVNHALAAMVWEQVTAYQKESFTVQSCYILFLYIWQFWALSCHICRHASAAFVFPVGP